MILSRPIVPASHVLCSVSRVLHAALTHNPYNLRETKTSDRGPGTKTALFPLTLTGEMINTPASNSPYLATHLPTQNLFKLPQYYQQAE